MHINIIEPMNNWLNFKDQNDHFLNPLFHNRIGIVDQRN